MLVVRLQARPLTRLLTPQVWDDRPAEVQRIALIIDDNLRRIGILQHLQGAAFVKGLNKCCDLGLRRVKAALDSLELGAMNKGLIPLYIDDNVIRLTALRIGFPATVSAAAMTVRSQDGFSAKGSYGFYDALVVCRYKCVVKQWRHALINPLNDRLTAQQS